jgi:hypothetical protein
MRSVFFWDITRRRVLIRYRRFGTTYRSHIQGSRPLKMGTIHCPETSVSDYRGTLRNIPDLCHKLFATVCILVFTVFFHLFVTINLKLASVIFLSSVWETSRWPERFCHQFGRHQHALNVFLMKFVIGYFYKMC